MSTYQATLPQVFPYVLRTTKATVRFMVRAIIGGDRPDALGGSSFAVTVDTNDGTWYLWMSETTKDFIVSRHPHTNNTIIPVGELIE